MSDSTQARPALRWQPNRVGLLFSLIFIPFLLWLGSWQLERADEKRSIVALHAANQAAPRVDLNGLIDSDGLQHRRTTVEGEFVASPLFVIDNKVRNGRPGYEIAQLFMPDGSQSALLVNRGWVAASLDRRKLPELEPLVGKLRIHGSLYRRLSGGLQLDDGVQLPLAERQRVGWLDVERVASWVETPLFSYQLRLERDSPAALETGWPVVAIYPQKHTGYAVQWFIMAIVLVGLTLVANSNFAAWLKARRQVLQQDSDNDAEQ